MPSIHQLDSISLKFFRTQLVHARARRRFQRGLKRRPMGLIKKLRKAKKEAPPNEKPAVVKTHLRDMIIVPEMVGSIIGIYNGKVRVYGCFLWTCIFPGDGVPSSGVIRFR